MKIINNVKIFSMLLALIFIISPTIILLSSCSDNTNTTDQATTITNEGTTIIPETTADPYANVRFGDDKNTLLLDVEWFTADDMSQYIEDAKNQKSEYMKSEQYLNLSEEEKNRYDTGFENGIKFWEQYLTGIEKKTEYVAKTVNGKPVTRSLVVNSPNGKPFDISQDCDSDGYYIFNVYPYYPTVWYIDENGAFQTKRFGIENNNTTVNSKYEYQYVLENEIIPYCDDLLAKGLIAQGNYDVFTPKDPLDFYIKAYFS
ncbi:MAG: hypothetical protein FWD71_20880 [Oscillospiraceae bacterium]|nr:hypothetical protein [Oscillospiraceae bacterium]